MENKFKLEWKESVTLLVACCTAREINAYSNSMYCDIKRQLKPLSRAFGVRRHEHTCKIMWNCDRSFGLDIVL